MMENYATIHEHAVQEYIKTLPEQEKARFIATTVNDILQDVQILERKQSIFSRSRQVSRRIQPAISFLQRYAMAIDTEVQFSPQPSALAWGCLRFLIQVM
jgi:hypothetical protein